MYLIKAVGTDLAKLVFSIHGVDAQDKCKFCKTTQRNNLLAKIAKLGHGVRSIASKCVISYRQNGKNDIT